MVKELYENQRERGNAATQYRDDLADAEDTTGAPQRRAHRAVAPGIVVAVATQSIVPQYDFLISASGMRAVADRAVAARALVPINIVREHLG